MQINKDFTIQKVGASYLAVPVGETSKYFHGMIRLNEVGAFIWNVLADRDMTEEELVDAVLAEYEADRTVVEKDVKSVLEILRENHCLV